MLQHWTVPHGEQTIRHVNLEIAVNANQTGVVGGVVDLGHADAVCDLWLSELLIRIRDDMGGVDEAGFP